MTNPPKTIILRHRKENLRKCSLRGLESREDMSFYTYPKDILPPLSNTILLALDAPIISPADNSSSLFLIDGTWKYSEVMYNQLEKPHLFEKRSLPKELKTAYPRRQDDCIDPERGLASVEALFAAYYFLGRDTSGLLDLYHWKSAFLEKNRTFFLNI
jgi:pre-rRNA-processing protein TSR3